MSQSITIYVCALNIHVYVLVPCKQLVSNVFTYICCIYLAILCYSLSLLACVSVQCTHSSCMHCARCNGRSDYWKDALASSDSERRYQSQENKVFNFDFL